MTQATESVKTHFAISDLFEVVVQGVAVPAEQARSGVICLHHPELDARLGIVPTPTAGTSCWQQYSMYHIGFTAAQPGACVDPSLISLCLGLAERTVESQTTFAAPSCSFLQQSRLQAALPFRFHTMQS